MKCFEPLGDFIRAGIHAPVLESAIHRICTVQKFSLYPFDIAKAGAVGKLVEHTGGNQLGHVSVGFFGFRNH